MRRSLLLKSASRGRSLFFCAETRLTGRCDRAVFPSCRKTFLRLLHLERVRVTSLALNRSSFYSPRESEERQAFNTDLTLAVIVGLAQNQGPPSAPITTLSHPITRKMPNHNSESTPLLESVHIHPDGESGRSGFHPSHFATVAWRSGSNAAKYTNLLWPFVIVAIVLNFAAPGLPIAIFATSYIAMVPVANLLGFAGQEFARKMPKVSGILIETAFGSIVEIILFIVLITKHHAGHGSSEHGNLIPVIQVCTTL
jgi:hypothetical protein